MKVLKVIRRSPFVLPLAFAATVAMIFITESSYQRAVNLVERLDELRTVRMNFRNLQQALVDAETGQRGYLLTDRVEYRQPYEDALELITESLAALTQYFQKYPKNQELYKKMEAVSQVKLSELALTLRLYDEGKLDASRDITLSGIGKENMDTLRAMIAQLLEEEGRNYVETKKSVFTILLFNRLGVPLLTLASLLGLYTYIRQSRAVEMQQQEIQNMVQAERDRLEHEVNRRTRELSELALHLHNAREDERSRLARDLHDELGALFTSAKLDTARIRSRLGDARPEIQERFAHIVETLNTGIALKRRIIEDLRPSSLSNLGLVATLEILAREFSERSGVQVHTTLEAVRLGPDTELVVYRLVQEAITNITKYAEASEVWIKLAQHEGQAEICVRDNGKGFDPGTQRTSAHGLVGMRFRIEAAGGVLSVVSAPGQGTSIRALLPQTKIETGREVHQA